MQLLVTEDYNALSRQAARLLDDALRAQPQSPASYLRHSGHVTVIADADAWP